MNRQRSIPVHYFVRAGILLGLAMYIAFLKKDDNMLFYISPRMEHYVKLSAIGLYVLGVYQAHKGLQSVFGKRSADCGCELNISSSKFRNVFSYGLLLVPLLFGFLLPDTTLNSSLAKQKGMNLSRAELIEQKSKPTAVSPAPKDMSEKQLDQLFKSDEFTEDFAALAKQLYKQNGPIQVKEVGFIEILSAIDLFTDPFIGRKMEISGFVYRDEQMPPDQFVVARFEMQCCSADAAPFGIFVHSDKAAQFETDSWVTVSGTIGKTKYMGNELMKLEATRIMKIEAPKTPYVYPNYDYVLQAASANKTN